MNLRTVTLKYLSWCPGMTNATELLPDRDIPERYIVMFGFLMIVSVGAVLTWLPKPPAQPLIVTIDGVVYPNDAFDETFNYASLRGKTISFHERINRTEFAQGTKNEKEEFEYSSMDEIRLKLENLNVPKIVIGFMMWASDGTYEEVALRWYGETFYFELAENLRGEFRKSFGSKGANEAYYEVKRGSPDFPGSGVRISKRYKTPSGSAGIWSLHVKLPLQPPYPATFSRALPT